MTFTRRKSGSQRAMAPLTLTLLPNVSSTSLTFQDQGGNWYVLTPSSREESRQLVSQAHIIDHYRES